MDVIENDIRLFQKSIRDYSPYDFSEYSIKSLRRRLLKILNEYDMDMMDVVRELRINPEFVEDVVMKITVTTTELFRDPEVWQQIRLKLIPELAKKKEVNIWHPGCSTGQEVYSMAMMLDDAGILDRSNIYASDLNKDALETARKGIYKYRFNKVYLDNYDAALNHKYRIEQSPKRIKWSKYLTIDEVKDQMAVRPFLVKKPVYKKIDLVGDSNHFFVNFDLIICRNVIIYFNYELQNKVFDLFYKSLNDKGCLVLGPHESILGPFSKRLVKNGLFYYKM